MSISIKWDITYKCNLNCKHCLNGDLLGHIDNELNTEEIINIIRKLSHMDIAYIHLLGGEPTARKDFVEIMDNLDNYGINFGFNTNGLKINDKNIIDRIICNKHLKNIVFSIEGPTAEINDSIRGKNVFDHIVKNMSELIRLKKEGNRDDLIITVNTVLSKKNIHNIRDMIRFCIDLQVDEFVLLQFIVKGNAIENNESISFNDELEVVKIIAENYSQYKDQLNFVPRFTYPMAKLYSEKVLKKEFPDIRHMCGAGTNFAYLNNKGELYPCDRYQNIILSHNKVKDINLVSNDFWDIWSIKNYSDLFKKTEGKFFYKDILPCNKCEFLQNTCFPCPECINKEVNEIRNCRKFMELINTEEGLNG